MKREHLRIRHYRNGSQRLCSSFGGADHSPCVVMLHGGGQTRHAWNSSATKLVRDGYRVITLDLRGHGDSDWAADGDYSIDVQVSDLLAVINTLPQPPVLVGASLGGLIALTCAGEHPGTASALVLVDVTPKVDPIGEARVKAFMQANPEGFANYEEAVEAVARYLPHRPRRTDTSGLQRNLRLRNGRYFWHWDPRLFDTLDASPQDLQARYEKAARAVDVPTLLVRGSRSELVGAEHVEHFLALIPQAQHVDVADAGHMVSGDSNEIFSLALEQFLMQVATPTEA